MRIKRDCMAGRRKTIVSLTVCISIAVMAGLVERAVSPIEPSCIRRNHPVSVLVPYNPNSWRLIRKRADAFERFSGVPVKIRMEDDVTYMDSVRRGLRDSDGEDVFLLPDWCAFDMIRRGLLSPLDNFVVEAGGINRLRSHWSFGSIEPWLHLDQLHGVPVRYEAMYLGINRILVATMLKDMFPVRVPTWQDLSQLNELAKEPDGTRFFGWPLAQGIEEILFFRWHWVLLYWQCTNLAGSGDLSLHIDPKASLKSTSILGRLAALDKHHLTQTRHWFEKGKQAVAIIDPALLARVRPGLDAEALTVVPLPQVKPEKPANLSLGYGFVVSARSRNPQVACELIEWFVRDPREWFQTVGYFCPSSEWWLPMIGEDAELAVLVHELEISHPFALLPNRTELMRTAEEATSSVFGPDSR